VARTDSIVTFTDWIDKKGRPTQYFYQLILSLWRKTGGNFDAVEGDDTMELPLGPQVGALANRVSGLESDALVPVLWSRLTELENRVRDLEVQ